MAGLRCAGTTPDVALVAATRKTVLQVTTPANQRARLLRWAITFDGIDPVGVPVEVRLLRQTTAGTLTALTPVRECAGSETPQVTAGHTATVEPDAGDVLRVRQIHPQGGYAEILPPDQLVEIPGATRLAIDCLAAAGVNVQAEMGWEE